MSNLIDILLWFSIFPLKLNLLCVFAAMDLHRTDEDAERESSFMMSKAVFITIFVAVAYIVLVVALMLWCRYKRQKNRNPGDLEKEEEGCDDTRSDVKSDEKEVSSLFYYFKINWGASINL